MAVCFFSCSQLLPPGTLCHLVRGAGWHKVSRRLVRAQHMHKVHRHLVRTLCVPCAYLVRTLCVPTLCATSFRHKVTQPCARTLGRAQGRAQGR